jgi:hypothetical protein
MILCIFSQFSSSRSPDDVASGVHGDLTPFLLPHTAGATINELAQTCYIHKAPHSGR